MIEQIVGILDQTNVDPHFICFEITEDALMQNVKSTVETLQILQKWGIRIAIDDFGIGYSSLNYIKQLPINTIKIDKSFVRDVNEKDQVIVKAIVTLAKFLSLKIVAEGVEEVM